MTDRILNHNRFVTNRKGAFRFKNVSGESMPPFSCFKVTAYDDTNDYYDADKPDGEGSLHFVSGPAAIADNAYGEAFTWGQSSQLGKTDGAFGETVGPVSGSWEMTTEGSGWSVFSSPSGGFAALLKEGGGRGSRRNIQVIMKEDLYAAVSTLTDPSTAEAWVLRKNSSGDMEVTTRTEVIVNRFKNISVDAGVYAKAEWIDGEWQLYAADCPDESSSSGSDSGSSGDIPNPDSSNNSSSSMWVS